MSINTANLITTTEGMSYLSSIASVNAALRADHRNIRVVMRFPHIGLSQSTPDEVEALSIMTRGTAEGMNEAYSPVDVCQLQSFDVIEGGESVTKRAFTISANFDIPEVVTSIRTLVLFCSDEVIDNRSDDEIEADGGRSASDVLIEDYNYVDTYYAAFAYTRVLDSTGTYQSDGVSVGASAYGRSRIRVHFNYIIDDTSGIADNISVDDRIYPYSSGYLSKRAFDEGLRQYEEALQTYRMEWEKFAMGQSPEYAWFAEAYTKSAPRNVFIVRRNELEETGWLTTDLETGSGCYLDTYQGYTPANYEYSSYSRKNQELCAYYEDVFMKTVMWKHIDEETGTVTETSEKCPVKIEALYYLRTGLPMTSTTSSNANKRIGQVSAYHVLRFAIQLYIDGELIRQIGEIMLQPDSSSVDQAVFAKVPNIGMIHLDSSGPAGMNDPILDFGMLLEGLEIKSEGAGTHIYDFNVANYLVRAKTGDTGSPGEQLVMSLVIRYNPTLTVGSSDNTRFDYNVGELGVGGYKGNGNVLQRSEPNFAAGNVIQSQDVFAPTSFLAVASFEINSAGTGLDSNSILSLQNDTSYEYLLNTSAIFGGFPVTSQQFSGTLCNQWGEETNGNVDANVLLSDLNSNSALRIVSDNKLYNCRAIIVANDLGANVINMTGSTTFTLYLMYEGGCKKFAIINMTSLSPRLDDLFDYDYVSNIRVLRVDRNGDDVSVELAVHYMKDTGGAGPTFFAQKIVRLNTSATVQYPFGNSINKFVSIKDVRRNTEVSTYSKPE